MNGRADPSIAMLGVSAILFGMFCGYLAVQFGSSLEIGMIAASVGFVFGCYLSTFVFDKILCVPRMRSILDEKAGTIVDISSLFEGGSQINGVKADRIWRHSDIARLVVLDTYAQDSQAMLDRIGGSLTPSIFLAVVGGLLSWVASFHMAGFATVSSVQVSASAAYVFPVAAWVPIATVAFTIARVYIPTLESAQRNRTLLRRI